MRSVFKQKVEVEETLNVLHKNIMNIFVPVGPINIRVLVHNHGAFFM